MLNIPIDKAVQQDVEHNQTRGIWQMPSQFYGAANYHWILSLVHILGKIF